MTMVKVTTHGQTRSDIPFSSNRWLINFPTSQTAQLRSYHRLLNDLQTWLAEAAPVCDVEHQSIPGHKYVDASENR